MTFAEDGVCGTLAFACAAVSELVSLGVPPGVAAQSLAGICAVSGSVGVRDSGVGGVHDERGGAVDILSDMFEHARRRIRDSSGLSGRALRGNSGVGERSGLASVDSVDGSFCDSGGRVLNGGCDEVGNDDFGSVCESAESGFPIVRDMFVGKHSKKNKKKKIKRRQKKERVDDVPEWRRGAVPNGTFGSHASVFQDCSEDTRRNLRESRAAALIASNKLSAERDRRRFEVLQANDVSDEVKRYRTGVRSGIEKNMVSIERAHSSLSSSGNSGGFVETLVGSDSISPNSSASSKEFFECKKAFLDSEKKLIEEKNRVELLISTLVGAGVEIPELGRKEYHDIGIYTDNSENRALFDDFSAVVEESASLYGLPGKVKFTPV